MGVCERFKVEPTGLYKQMGKIHGLRKLERNQRLVCSLSNKLELDIALIVCMGKS